MTRQDWGAIGELLAFVAYLGSLMRMWETFYFERQAGRFVSSIYHAWWIQLIDAFGNPGAKEYWALRKHQFTPEFAEYIDSTVVEVSPRDMYPTNNQAA